MHKTLALFLLLLATPALADSPAPQAAHAQSTQPASSRPADAADKPLPAVPAPAVPQTPETGWADRAASLFSIFAGATTVLLLLWKTLSNRARQRREHQGKD